MTLIKRATAKAAACLLFLASPISAAGSYDLVDFEKMTSTHRVIIGLPADDITGTKGDSPRVVYRKNEIMKMVDAHLDRMSASTDSLVLSSVEYAYVTQLEVAFIELFPKHTKQGAKAAGLDEVPGTPALKLINIETKESMYPDWPILLADFPAEIDRLVRDYERWQGQTKAFASPDPASDDGVSLLHQVNLAPTVAQATGGVVAMFYAPWCHYSKLMLPKYGAAAKLVMEAEAAGLLPEKRVVIGQVNVDEEGDLRTVYNISTYPSLKVYTRPAPRGGAGNRASLPGKKFPPAATFDGLSASATEIASHALATLSWSKKGRPFAVLGDPNLSERDGVAYDTATRYAGLAQFVDASYARDANRVDPSARGVEEGDPAPAEARRVVSAVVVFPDAYAKQVVGTGGTGAGKEEEEEEEEEVAVPLAARVGVAGHVAGLVAGGCVFVAAAVSSADAAAVLPLLPGADEGGGAGALAAAVAVAAASPTGHLLVLSPGNGGVLAHPLLPVTSSSSASSSTSSESEDAAAAAFKKWAIAATWPLVSRFDPSAAQGDRIRSGVVTSLLVLVGEDESDFMFEGFKESLVAAARAHVGAAHFLYAGSDEPRIGSLLRSARARVPGGSDGNPSVAVLVSMLNAFKPRKLEGTQISAEGIGRLLVDAQAEASARDAKAAEMAGGDMGSGEL